MKRIFRMLTLALMLMLCACMASCGTSGSSGINGSTGTSGSTGTTGTAGFGNAVITETKNDAADAEIPTLSVGYLTEEAYDNGNFAEDAITKTTDFSSREAQYMVVDLKIKTLIDNVENQSLKVVARASDAFALTVIVEDAPTGKLEPVDNPDGSRTYDLIYSIPENKGEEKAVRMILKLLPNVGGNVNVDITVSGENGTAVSGKTGVSTAFSVPSLNLKFMLKNDNSYSVRGTGVCTDSKITVPSTYNGAPVTSIEPHEFSDCYDLTAIVIPDSVTSIAERAFDGCGALTEITVHENNAHYCSENGILFNKEKTELLRYPEGKTETTYSIPDSVTEIGKWAFYCCRNLTDMTIPDNVTCVEVGAFSACYDLTTIVIPESVTSIGYDAFGGCSSLTSMTLPFVGNTADGTSNTHFGYIFGAFSYSDHGLETPSSLQTVVITGGSCIDDLAFYGCGSLTSIAIPDSVTSIGSSAFNGCSALTSIVIPKDVTSIGSSAFKDCSALTSIVIPEGVTSIGTELFCNCSSLTSVIIPDSVTDIGAAAFSGCGNLTSIEIPEGVLSIGFEAFRHCNGLTSMTLPFVGNTVNGTGETHFGYIFGANVPYENSEYVPASLKTVVITGGLSIGDRAFEDCRDLTSIVIPDSVTSIGERAFNGCISLTGIVIPDGVTSIGSSAFNSCINLMSVTIGGGVKAIGDYAFNDCSALTGIQFGGTVAQWKAISFGSYWDYDTGNYSVTCTDGTVSKN